MTQKKMSELEILEKPSDDSYVIVEEKGEAKRIHTRDIGNVRFSSTVVTNQTYANWGDLILAIDGQKYICGYEYAEGEKFLFVLPTTAHGDTDPTGETPGTRGVLYTNQNTGRMFKCTSVNHSPTEWEVINETFTGHGAPTTSTVGYVGDLYIDLDGKKLYACTAAGEEYTWDALT